MDEKIKVKVLKSTLNIILLLAICIINGCFDFLSWEFHFERILTAVFWVKTGAKFATLICAKEIDLRHKALEKKEIDDRVAKL